ncbi:MAG TPA: cytochrome P450 [Chloroflexia bacterium]|nr:cytochrome P450 [Chloroflexia bacterium]
MTKTYSELPVARFSEETAYSGELPQLLARFSEEHGPIFKRVVQSGPQAGLELLFMLGPEANRFVMLTHRDHFSHEQGWTPLIGETLGKGLLNMDEPEHTVHRRMWNPAFASSYMSAYLPVMQAVIERRTRDWPAQPKINLYDEAREITFDVAAIALAGFEPGPQVDRLRELFYILIHGWQQGNENWSDFWQRYQQAQRDLSLMLLGMINERRKRPVTDRPRDVLEMIVQARDEHGEGLTDAQVLAHLNILLVAGHETTTTLSAWALFLLSQMDAYRQQITAELASIPTGPDGAPQIEALRSARLLDAFIKETGRLYPPVLNVPRGVIKDFEFGGYHVPAGKQVRLSLAGSHMLSSLFENPGKFDPERFLAPRDEEKKNPYGLVTFGGGPRVCIGMYFAQVEVKALIAHVLSHYRLEPLPGQHPHHAGYWNATIPEGLWVKATAL